MRITIDGRELQAKPKQTVLEVARENKIYIPSLCDHSQLEPFTGCRLCIVEVQGRRGYPPSCATYAEEGMTVKTNTPVIRKMREQVLELILSEHPSACLVCTEKNSCDDYKSTIRKVDEVTGCVHCPSNGRCELQRVVEAAGLKRVSFPFVYRGFEVKKNDPFFDRNYNLCILCGRCVRICHEVRGASAIAFVYRGPQTVIGTVLDRPLEDVGCQFCGACVDICPTGTLFERSLRYEVLPERKERTICPLCSLGCELEAELREGRIISTRPLHDGIPNQGQACVKGRFCIKELVHSPRRLLKPLVRKEKALEEASWEEALDFIAHQLKAYRGEETAFILSPQVSLEDNYVFQKFARQVLKTENLSCISSLAPASFFQETLKENGLEPGLNFTFDDVCQAKVILLLGSDIAVSHPILWLAVFQALRAGAKLIIASPVEFFSSRHAWLNLQLNPESEFYLLSGISKILAEDGLAEDPQLEGLASFKSHMAEISLAEVEKKTGIKADALRKAAEAFARRSPGLILWGSGLSQSPQGKASVLAAWNLALQAGARLIPLGQENNQRGLAELGHASLFKLRNIGNLIQEVSEGKIKAVYQAGPFPLDKEIKPEFLIIQDCFENDACAGADVILPAATFAEAEGTVVNMEGRVQRFIQVLKPQGESRSDWWIVSRLAQRMGQAGFNYKKPSDIFKEMREAVYSLNKISYPSLKKNRSMFVQEEKKGERFSALKSSLVSLTKDENYPFSMLVNYGLDYYRNCDLTQEVKGLSRLRNSRWLRINPQDAERLKLKEGDLIEVEFPEGKMPVIARLSDRIPQGLIESNFTWSQDTGHAAARLLTLSWAKAKLAAPLQVRVTRGR